MTVQTLLFGVGGVLLSGSLVGLAVTLRIDRALRRLIPPATEARWREDMLRDIHRFRGDPLISTLEALDASLTPLRWRRDYHGASGLRLLDRLALAVPATAVTATLAVMVLAAAIAR